MESLKQFKEKVGKLDAEIKVYYKNYKKVNSKEFNFIGDGIVNTEEYFKSDIKILWILKEAYDGDENETWWSLSKLIGAEGFLSRVGGEKTTWPPIIYASYGILNGFKLYNDMDYIEKNPDMPRILRKIAFMNVQKFPAGTTSINGDITKAYQLHRNILLKQIDTYQPNVIIGGNTMWNFHKDLLDKDNLSYKFDPFDYWTGNGKIFIDAKHPAYIGSKESKEEYINEIIETVKEFRQTLK